MEDMATWLLILIGLAIPRVTVTLRDTVTLRERIYDVSVIYRILLFIICCIWG